MTIAIFGNTFRPTIIAQLKVLFNYFRQREVRVLLDSQLFEYFKANSEECPDDLLLIENDDFGADLALSIGGDGTFLNTAARIGAKNIPILGINTGRLGFLADVPGDQLEKALDAIFNQQLNIEERTLLKVAISDKRNMHYPNVLNDVSILKQDSSSMLTIHASVNGKAFNSYHSDGLIVATPTGSTAYSLSVGGPILVPQAKNIILSPIASHSLTVRPLVIPDDWIVDLEVRTRSGYYQVSLDGRSSVLEQELKIRISKADYTIKLARQQHHTFVDTLKSKLMWGIDKRN
ncbi:MAG: NAD kinase [Paludibacter sp. 47-17]|nr:MAG: NAD kinase [Paludibacter sp. 47-17]